MADKCTGFLKTQPEPKMSDGEHKSSVTSDSAASTEVKTAINVDNAKSMLSIVGAAEIVSSKVALVSRTTAYTPPNETAATKTTAANLTSTPHNTISSKTVRYSTPHAFLFIFVLLFRFIRFIIVIFIHVHLHLHRYHFLLVDIPKCSNQNKINRKTLQRLTELTSFYWPNIHGIRWKKISIYRKKKETYNNSCISFISMSKTKETVSAQTASVRRMALFLGK